MSAYAIAYRSAYDNQRFGTDPTAPKQETILIAPSSWDTDEVIDAFINQRPGSTVISFTKAHLPDLR